jgi:PIN domain nuclease of toxin-antitoxin system
VIDAFVTDTHPLVWYAAGQQRRLGRQARLAFEAFEAGQVYLHIPVPVVMETWFLSRGQKVAFKPDFTQWWTRFQTGRLQFEDLQAKDIFAALDLNWKHSDIFDRMIVATALRIGLPLVTADGAITDWGGVDILWS